VGTKKIVDNIIATFFAGSTEIDCATISSQPTLLFTINSTVYQVPPQDYILVETVGGSTSCVLGIEGMDLPL